LRSTLVRKKNIRTNNDLKFCSGEFDEFFKNEKNNIVDIALSRIHYNKIRLQNV
jgi:hypothetical protein